MLDRTQSPPGRLLLFLPVRGFLHPQTLLLRLFILLLEERLIDVLFTPDQRSGGTRVEVERREVGVVGVGLTFADETSETVLFALSGLFGCGRFAWGRSRSRCRWRCRGGWFVSSGGRRCRRGYRSRRRGGSSSTKSGRCRPLLWYPDLAQKRLVQQQISLRNTLIDRVHLFNLLGLNFLLLLFHIQACFPSPLLLQLDRPAQLLEPSIEPLETPSEDVPDRLVFLRPPTGLVLVVFGWRPLPMLQPRSNTLL